MNAALERYQDELLSIRQAVPGLVAHLSDAQFHWSPAPGRWSIAQCFDHLNATARAFVPAIDRAMDDARTRGLTGSGPFVYSLFERLCLTATRAATRLRMPALRVLLPAPEQADGRGARRIRGVAGSIWANASVWPMVSICGGPAAARRFPLLTGASARCSPITLAHERAPVAGASGQECDDVGRQALGLRLTEFAMARGSKRGLCDA